MRKRASILLAAASAAVLSLGAAPAPAASGYHMNGFGEISIGGGGLPACVEGTPSNCTTPFDSTFSWGELTVQGLGVLQDNEVAGQYLCSSEGSGFTSRIKGHTTNFVLTFNFQCTNSAGVGPTAIDGWFSNCVSSCAGAYKSVSSHPHPGPSGPGMFAFKGFFRAGNTHVDPDTITASNGDPMTCGGGFAPTGTDGSGFSDMTITTAAFLGHCNAAAA